jgi:hypothetical protein
MTVSTNSSIKPGCLVSGPTLPERIEVLAIVPMGDSESRFYSVIRPNPN